MRICFSPLASCAASASRTRCALFFILPTFIWVAILQAAQAGWLSLPHRPPPQHSGSGRSLRPCRQSPAATTPAAAAVSGNRLQHVPVPHGKPPAGECTQVSPRATISAMRHPTMPPVGPYRPRSLGAGRWTMANPVGPDQPLAPPHLHPLPWSLAPWHAHCSALP